MTSSTLQALVAVSLFGSAILVIICVLLLEIKQRYTQNLNEHENSKHWMNRISLSILILFGLTAIFCLLNKFEPICFYTYSVLLFAYNTGKLGFRFYEISTVQYCFSGNQYTQKYSYPNYIFCMLYIIGFILIVLLSMASLYAYNVEKAGINGCIFVSSGEHEYWLPVMGVLCHIWDWTILSIYIYRLWQLHKDVNPGHQENQNVDDVNIQLLKIKFTLFKIVLLTRIYELAALMVTSVFIMKPGIFVQRIMMFIDIMTSVMIIYLMIDHNNSKYILFLRVIRKLKCVAICCCCCKGVINASIMMYNENNKETQPYSPKAIQMEIDCANDDGLLRKRVEDISNEKDDTTMSLDSGASESNAMTSLYMTTTTENKQHSHISDSAVHLQKIGEELI